MGLNWIRLLNIYLTENADNELGRKIKQRISCLHGYAINLKKETPLSWQRRYNEMKWQMFQLRLNLKANSIQVPNYDEIQVGDDVIRHDQSALETSGQTPDIRFPRDLWQVAAIPLTIDL